MKDKTDCAVFKDLYPSYLASELEEETSKWMEEHFNACSSCKTWKETYREEEHKEEALEKDGSLDNLREEQDEAKVIKRARIFLGIGISIVIVLALWMSFWIVS